MSASSSQGQSDAEGESHGTRQPYPLDELPVFPEFRPLDLTLLLSVRVHAAQFDPYSDFDATSLWAWSSSVDDGYRVCRRGKNLVVEFGDYLSGERFLSFLGTDDVDSTAIELTEYAPRAGLQPYLHLVPSCTVKLLDPGRWQIVSDRSAFDYVYDVAKLAVLEGKDYKSIRGSVNRFERTWRDRLHIEWLTAKELTEARSATKNIFDSWFSRSSGGSGASGPERRAFDHLVQTAAVASDGLSGWSGMAILDERPVAVWVVERTRPDWFMWHFMKFSNSEATRDLESFLTHELCRRGHSDGVRYLNTQQDLGIDGLRAAKAKFKPLTYLGKFTVAPRALGEAE